MEYKTSEKERARKKAYYEAHKEEIKAKFREYDKKHKGERAAYNKEYRKYKDKKIYEIANFNIEVTSQIYKEGNTYQGI